MIRDSLLPGDIAHLAIFQLRTKFFCSPNGSFSISAAITFQFSSQITSELLLFELYSCPAIGSAVALILIPILCHLLRESRKNNEPIIGDERCNPIVVVYAEEGNENVTHRSPNQCISHPSSLGANPGICIGPALNYSECRQTNAASLMPQNGVGVQNFLRVSFWESLKEDNTFRPVLGAHCC
ncbi:hypothetical protein CEXT_489351 [Caerostris extrusa]|uniref:Uncharacterized protein n=1 Tax=Caerostris extrusa TaxID=172846 RepID=A0AAV4MPS9_CAEEX|nr:hypothetical protein CEXT_489351 [Caerostris extrusa]